MTDEMPRFKLTIGELFPARDVVAQWVYSVTCIYEDVQVCQRPMEDARTREDARASIFYYRLLLSRLYEARRIIFAIDKYPDVRAFGGTMLEKSWGGHLRQAYKRTADNGPSLVEQLYGDVRHRHSHFAHIGSKELRKELVDHQNFPARMVVHTEDDKDHPEIEYQWVTAMKGRDAFGADYGDVDFLSKMKHRSDTTAAVVQSWVMLSLLVTLVYSKSRGIDSGRLVDDPKVLAARLQEHRERDEGSGSTLK